ncbi:MAG: polyprenyl synthetase family protein [Eubacteriales bacterium]|nr:polyprenyl synthetase family protein [Eubacteriales bacterium]
MNFEQTMEIYRGMIENGLEACMARESIPLKLREAMAYSLCGGGKRLRPVLALAACDMFEGNLAAALPLSCALEMIHAYSLIHDDLPCMDDDDFRRGKPSSHKAFGEAMAVLAGDALLSYAFETLSDAALLWQPQMPSYLVAVREIARAAGASGMVAGQAADLEGEGSNVSAGRERLRYIHTRKTGAMLRASLMAGAYVGTPSDAEAAALSRFGGLFGLLFQITDDVLDEEGSLLTLGKTPGKDKAAQKLTYPACVGLEESKRMARETAEEALAVLEGFGERAEFLAALTERTLMRKN